MKLASFIILFFFTGCVEFSETKKVPGPYYLSKQTGAGWNLYYGNNGPEHGRITDIDNIGWNDHYIYTENNGVYYLLDKRQDSLPLNSDEIVMGPLDHSTFTHITDSLKIENIRFQLELEK